jgi:hypothetical protein
MKTKIVICAITIVTALTALNANAQSFDQKDLIKNCNLEKSSVFMFKEKLTSLSADFVFNQNKAEANFYFNGYQEDVHLVNPEISQIDNVVSISGTHRGVNSLDQDITINTLIKAKYENNQLIAIELKKSGFLLFEKYFCTVK